VPQLIQEEVSLICKVCHSVRFPGNYPSSWANAMEKEDGSFAGKIRLLMNGKLSFLN
jgi:hypothetical protein